MRNKDEIITQLAEACYKDDSDKTFALARVLWELAKRTRYEDDARLAIRGACPYFFKDEVELEYNENYLG